MEERSGSRQEGITGCLSSLRVIVWPLLFMSAAAFSSWETYKRGRDASSACLQMGTWLYFLGIFMLILKKRKTTLLQGTKT